MPELPTLSLVRTLCQALDAEDVGYCHWKSTTALERAAAGDTDLDLLVARTDSARFLEILHRLGFKEALVAGDRGLPGVAHHYGYDEAAGRFVHVHVHYQLVLGDDMTKNYRLPLERAFLESATPRGPFRVPAPELELIVLVIRLVLKHGTGDAVLRGRGRIPVAARRELDDLRARTDRDAVDRVLAAHLPGLPARVFQHCLAAVEPGAPPWPRLAAAHRLHRALAGEARSPVLLDLARKQWRWGRRVAGWLGTRRSPPKRLACGGALIALVGGDGAGKSTAVAEIHRWLSPIFATRAVHLGKPPESVLSFTVAVALWLARRRGAGPAPGAAVSGNGGFPGWLWLFRRVLVARRRYRAYARARRFATNGGLVVCDRYPIPGLRLMDGPQCAETLPGASGRGLAGYLARKEAGYYRRILPPDLLLVLLVDPETAAQRKRDEVPEAVRARAGEVWRFDWAATGGRVVDASAPRAQVAARLRALIWGSL